ncbi:helix-turn-helix transcriptional regulator [Fusobacterium animalis]|uniref:helix-turn-helix domain-containing protein n=1 Tax=Fusobacterium animalis TaxID=76859 RepID=UPI0030CAB505
MENNYSKTQQTIAKRLKEKREENGFTLDDVAKKINVSKVTLHKYENLIILNIPIDNIEKLAKLYGTTPKYIMGWSDSDTLEKEKESVKTAARDKKVFDKYSKLNEAKRKIVEALIDSYFDENVEDEED